MKSWGRLVAVALTAAAVPASLLVFKVIACGPDFEPEVFVTEHHPDRPAQFVEGHLGILQSGYYHAELVIAYRYLSGGSLSGAEKAAYGPAIQASDDLYAWNDQRDKAATLAMNQWLSARAAVVPGTAALPVSEIKTGQRNMGTYSIEDDELNCTDGAFLTAAKTLQARAATWGGGSPELNEWLSGQDSVFANCNGPASIPDPAKPDWKALLREDRAYQIAAANFYAGNYDNAIADFVAIGKDKVSPWSRWGDYLAARAEVRKAAQAAKPADIGDTATFDNTGLQTAQTRLQRILSQTSDPEISRAAQTELNFVLVRLDPSKRLDVAAAALAGPSPDPNFAQDLTDLDFLMDRKATGSSDLVHWIEVIQRTVPKSQSAPLGPLDQWKQTRSLPWLVAAITAPPYSTSDAPLMEAAAKVKPDSPAYETVNSNRAARLVQAGKLPDARALLTAMLARLDPGDSASTRNGLLWSRMETARSLAEFLADAPRTLIDPESSAADLAACSNGQPAGASGCTGEIPSQQFDADAAGYLDIQAPLSLLKQAAESGTLPAHLRQAVAEVAWVRALGLGDAASVKQMSPLLPESVRKTAGESDGFPATLALLHAPGLRPFLDQGVQRSATFAEVDPYRDNWWCGRWTDGSVPPGSFIYGPQPTVLPPLAFLTTGQRQQAAAEATRLNALPEGLAWVGQRAIAYVKAHPTDKDAAETLALVVQGTRRGCEGEYSPKVQTSGSPQHTVSKEAFELLHSKYPKSEWALKTKYYY